MVEFVLCCPYFELETLKFLQKEMWEGNGQTESVVFEYNRLPKKSCGIFIEFSIVHKIGHNNAI